MAVSVPFNPGKSLLTLAEPETEGLETAAGLETKVFATAPMTPKPDQHGY